MEKKRMRFTILFAVLLSICLIGNSQAIAKDKEELVIAVAAWGNEALLPKSEGGKAMDYMKFLYDGLFGTDPDLIVQPEYGVAIKWDMSPDGLTWTVTMRKGVKFHDGTEVTAKDAKLSIEQIGSDESKFASSAMVKRLVKEMVVKDPYTLVIHCTKPALILPTLLNDNNLGGLIIPKDYLEKVGEEKFMKHPVGSGPYKFHSHIVGSNMKFEAAGKHWRDGVPRYKYVNMRLISEETSRVAMLKTGEADIVLVSRDRAKELKKDGFNIVTKKEADVIELHCNMQWTNKAFSDVRFRKALALAVDKEAIVKHIFAGNATPAGTWPGANIKTCGGKDNPRVPYNPEEAKRLLKESGFEGFEFKLISYPRAGCPEFPKVVEAVGGYWQKVGLKPKIIMTEYSSFRKKLRNQKTQGTVSGANWSGMGTCFDHLRNYQRKLYSKNKGRYAQHPKYDKLIDKAKNTLDIAEMEKTVREINQLVYDDHIWIVIGSVGQEIATAKHVPAWDPGRRRQDRNYNELIRQK